MTSAFAPESLVAVADTVRALTAQATALTTRAATLRKELAQLDGRIRSVSDALDRTSRRAAPADGTVGGDPPPGNPA
ncbi:hypothetical protein ABZ464_42220 [Streptomyces sp. NPDC005820]|uniref:hypothetical protein n=1 Tax=Streptomyces sp. NPDC005820 TaxID=3157069 RepID=UPI003410B491